MGLSPNFCSVTYHPRIQWLKITIYSSHGCVEQQFVLAQVNGSFGHSGALFVSAIAQREAGWWLTQNGLSWDDLILLHVVSYHSIGHPGSFM
jgi:hypothetical protein